MARRPAARPDINVTPLVDVVLVLLIIFMVVTPQMEAGAAVDLPGIEHPDAENRTKLEPITVSLTTSGQLYLEKEALEREALLDRLRAIHDRDATRKVLLKGDKSVRYAEVRGLFAQCQAIGFPGISMQVGDRAKQGAGETR